MLRSIPPLLRFPELYVSHAFRLLDRLQLEVFPSVWVLGVGLVVGSRVTSLDGLHHTARIANLPVFLVQVGKAWVLVGHVCCSALVVLVNDARCYLLAWVVFTCINSVEISFGVVSLVWHYHILLMVNELRAVPISELAIVELRLINHLFEVRVALGHNYLVRSLAEWEVCLPQRLRDHWDLPLGCFPLRVALLGVVLVDRHYEAPGLPSHHLVTLFLIHLLGITLVFFFIALPRSRSFRPIAENRPVWLRILLSPSVLKWAEVLAGHPVVLDLQLLDSTFQRLVLLPQLDQLCVHCVNRRWLLLSRGAESGVHVEPPVLRVTFKHVSLNMAA